MQICICRRVQTWCCTLKKKRDDILANTVNSFVSVSELGLKTPSGVVYEKVNFDLNKGEVAALFGSAGSGKTALLLTLGARMKFLKGSAKVAGFDLRKQRRKVREITGISVIHRINDVPEFLTVKDILSSDLSLASKKANSSSVKAYLEDWNFSIFANKQYFSLSCEERAYFDIMLACTGEPEVLLVDEIQNGLTQHASVKLVKFFEELSKTKNLTTIFGTNEYEIAENASSVIVMSVGAKQQREAVLAKEGTENQPRLAGWGNNAEMGVDRHPNKDTMFKKPA